MRFQGRGSTRPSKFSATMGLVVGVGMLLTVVGFFVKPAVGIAMFVGVWVTVVVLGLIQSAANVFGEKGIPHEESSYAGSIAEAPRAETSDFGRKLRELQSLKDDGLISAEEFQEKRQEILGERW